MLNCFSRVQLFETLWIVALQGPLWDSAGKNTRVGLPFPPPGDLPDLGIEPVSLTFLALAGGFFTTTVTGEAPLKCILGVLKSTHRKKKVKKKVHRES